MNWQAFRRGPSPAIFHAVRPGSASARLGGCGGRIKPEREPNRRRLEREFMAVRDKLYACAGWQALPPFVKQPVQRIFLRIAVNEDKLAV